MKQRLSLRRDLGNRLTAPGLVLVLAVLAAACGNPQALGDANALIVGVPDEAWAEVQDEVEAALEPRAFTVRDERIFRVTQMDPRDRRWNDLRRFRQILLIGEPGDPWIAEALNRARGPAPSPPGVVEAHNVWAQGQRVFVLLVPPGTGAGAARPLLPEVGQTALQQYHAFLRNRMYASGVDSVRADSLRRQAGFSLLLPRVYQGAQLEPNTYLFRNEHPDPSDLLRSVLVTWVPRGERSVTESTALAWREEVSNRFYQPPQLTQQEQVEAARRNGAAAEALQVQGVWSNPPGQWPAAGPFLTRLVECPDRLFLVDGWVYAPGREKYEYLYQINAILDTFQCAGTAATAG